ncbi:MAG: hypothetical protein LBJ07_03325 [Actinomycetes bacterium]|jgi:tetratricopeptide (TPR) repeat protein|nr:hypothetical protein [Actinomycetes bacterium]
MQINKNSSPVWVRIVIWVLIIGLVAGIGILGIFQVVTYWNQSNTTPQQQPANAEEAQQQIATIDARYQPEVNQLSEEASATPEKKEALVSLARAYMDWGGALVAISDENAQATGMMRIAQSQEWWQKAWDLDPTDTEVGGDLATSLYYSGDTTGAVQIARKVLDIDPKFGTMWFNLGQFLATDQPQLAIEAFEQSLKYDTNNQYGTQAQQYLEELKAQ